MRYDQFAYPRVTAPDKRTLLFFGLDRQKMIIVHATFLQPLRVGFYGPAEMIAVQGMLRGKATVVTVSADPFPQDIELMGRGDLFQNLFDFFVHNTENSIITIKNNRIVKEKPDCFLYNFHHIHGNQ